MKIVFLGSASCYPSPSRGVSCTALQLDTGAVWLFDCGEGSQIQIQKSCIKPGRVTKIFISHLHGDHVFGLPGLLCTMGNGLDPEKAKDTVVELYGPLGLRKYVTTCLGLSRSPLIYKLAIHEMIPRPDQHPPDWDAWPVQHELTDPPLPQEASYRRVQYSEDTRCWDLAHEGFWGPGAGSGVRVVAAALRHRIPSWGFLVIEPSSPGKLDTEKLTAAGINPGPAYGKLKAGHKVTLDSGQVLDPADYLGPRVPGRSVAILGDTCDSAELLDVAPRGLDVLIHEATMENKLREKCVEFGHSTPAMAAQVAAAVNAKTLILSHVSPRYKPLSLCDDTSKREESAQILLDEAVQHLKDMNNCDTNVIIAEDFTEFVMFKQK